MVNLTTKNEAKQLLDSINEATDIVPKLYKKKDKDFVRMYGISKSDIKELIGCLNYESVRQKIKCEDKRFNVDYLYDFKTLYQGVDIFGIEQIVPVYIKIGRDITNHNTIIVVSLHDDEY